MSATQFSQALYRLRVAVPPPLPSPVVPPRSSPPGGHLPRAQGCAMAEFASSGERCVVRRPPAALPPHRRPRAAAAWCLSPRTSTMPARWCAHGPAADRR